VFRDTIHHITAMREFGRWSPEELRWQDYQVLQMQRSAQQSHLACRQPAYAVADDDGLHDRG
jgi:hypothetical protein